MIYMVASVDSNMFHFYKRNGNDNKCVQPKDMSAQEKTEFKQLLDDAIKSLDSTAREN